MDYRKSRSFLTFFSLLHNCLIFISIWEEKRNTLQVSKN